MDSNLFAFYYFKKATKLSFFKLLEIIIFLWELVLWKIIGNYYQKWCSMDLSCSIASKILDNTLDITDNLLLHFSSMKKNQINV